ncbi:MAG: hypothetical protein RL095_3327 [Verrucomicrobiota bacterium]
MKIDLPLPTGLAGILPAAFVARPSLVERDPLKLEA